VIGISFFTFQSLSFLIDIQQGKIRQTHTFLTIFLYLIFFPQIVAGPIIRTNSFIPRLNKVRFRRELFFWGVFLIVYGLFYKIVLADNIAPFVDSFFKNPDYEDGFYQLLTMYAYSFQIYCDFHGYSSVAIGLAAVLGFSFPVNFNEPYISTTLKEFWSRWHISLSKWFSDYLYISIGGSYKGKFRSYINLFITMGIAGLWHGSSWNFFIWGLGWATLMTFERLIFLRNKGEQKCKRQGIISKLILAVIVFNITTILWIPFRSSDLESSWNLVSNIFVAKNYTLNTLVFSIEHIKSYLALSCAILLTSIGFLRQKILLNLKRLPVLYYSILSLLMSLAIILFNNNNRNEFIYFQF